MARNRKAIAGEFADSIEGFGANEMVSLRAEVAKIREDNESLRRLVEQLVGVAPVWVEPIAQVSSLFSGTDSAANVDFGSLRSTEAKGDGEQESSLQSDGEMEPSGRRGFLRRWLPLESGQQV
jgi:hypothetical protein